MSSFFKGYNEVWKCSKKIMSYAEKHIFLTLVGYWKRATEEYHYKYLQISYRHIMNAVGETDPHIIQKYVKNLMDKGLLEIINLEDVIRNHHVPRFVLKEEKINVFFNTDIFKTALKKKNKPAGTAQSSTQTSLKEKGQAEPEKREGAPPGRKASLDYIANINKTLTALKKEQNGIQEERREQVAEKPAFLWDEL